MAVDTDEDKYFLTVTSPDGVEDIIRATYSGANGVYNASFRPAYGGSYTVTTELLNGYTDANPDEDTSVGSSITVAVTPFETKPLNSSYAIKDDATPEVGKATTFIFQARDKDDADLSTTDDEFKIIVVDPYGAIFTRVAKPDNKSPGQYKVNFTPKFGGDHSVSATLSNGFTRRNPTDANDVPEDSGARRVLSAVSPSTLSVGYEQSIPAQAELDPIMDTITIGESIDIAVTAKDASGTATTDPNDTVTVTFINPAGSEASFKGAYNSSTMKYEASFTPVGLGDFQISVIMTNNFTDKFNDASTVILNNFTVTVE